jgi:hypothetical protein
MTIRFVCSSGHRLSVPEEWAGRRIRCAACKEVLCVPSGCGGRVSAKPAPPSAPRMHLPPAVRLMPEDVYQADEGHRSTVRWVALILGLVVALSVAPVFCSMRMNLAVAPDWARVVLLVGVVQAAYICWMLSAPDWVSMWVVTLVFAAVSTLYAVGTAVAVATPLGRPMILEMGQVRESAPAWCGSVLLAMSLATYLCGRTATRWRRVVELATAGQGKGRGLAVENSESKTDD